MIGIYMSDGGDQQRGQINGTEQRKQNWEDLGLKACGSEEEGILAVSSGPFIVLRQGTAGNLT